MRWLHKFNWSASSICMHIQYSQYLVVQLWPILAILWYRDLTKCWKCSIVRCLVDISTCSDSPPLWNSLVTMLFGKRKTGKATGGLLLCRGDVSAKHTPRAACSDCPAGKPCWSCWLWHLTESLIYVCIKLKELRELLERSKLATHTYCTSQLASERIMAVSVVRRCRFMCFRRRDFEGREWDLSHLDPLKNLAPCCWFFQL